MRSVTQPRILLDTNILLAYINAQHPRHPTVRGCIEQLLSAGYELLLAPQCLYEFYVVATRPVTQNGLGMTPSDAEQCLQSLTAVFTLLEDAPSIVSEWRALCLAHQVSGKRAHDVRLIAWMVRHGVHELLTLNPSDFQAFQGRILIHGI